MEKVINFKEIANEDFLLKKYSVVDTNKKVINHVFTNSSHNKILFRSPLLKIDKFSVTRALHPEDMKLILKEGSNKDEYKLFCENIKNLEKKMTNSIEKDEIEKKIIIYKLCTKEKEKLPNTICKMICDYLQIYKSAIIKNNLIYTRCIFNNINNIYTSDEVDGEIKESKCPINNSGDLISCIRSIYHTKNIELQFILDFNIILRNKSYYSVLKIKRIELYREQQLHLDNFLS
jgi:hypothetical protein